MNKDIIKKGLIISKTLLFRYLLIQAGSFLRKPERVLSLADQAAAHVRRYQGLGDFAGDVVAGVKQLIRMVRAYARGEYNGITRTQVALIIGSILYFLTPVDIIPDAIPILGLLDDISLFAWLVMTIGEEMHEFAEWEQGLAASEEEE